jgi:hypothetical protein
MNSDYINLIPNINSYLELGLGKGFSFEEVKASYKVSVDVSGKGTFNGTTDEFFDQLPKSKKFDVIFIDADHEYRHVLRDLKNSIKHCNEWVVIHDLIPPSEKYAVPRFCNDGYKLIYYLFENGLEFFPMNENFGMTFIGMPFKMTVSAITKKYTDLTYKEFAEYISTKRLYSKSEIEEMLK